MGLEKNYSEQIRRNADTLKTAVYGSEIRRALTNGFSITAEVIEYAGHRLDEQWRTMMRQEKKICDLDLRIFKARLLIFALAVVLVAAACFQWNKISELEFQVSQLQEQITQTTIIKE